MARTLTNEIIAAAIAGFETQKAKIDAQIADLRQTLRGGRTESAAPTAPAKRKRRLSAAGRRAIAAAARKRWAAVKASKAAGTPAPNAAKKSAGKKAPTKKAAKKTAAK
ncbi:MAG: hypothetical protein WCB12_13950 [Bryobacteraceae bacterium]